jgi:hypothetical protein
VAFKKSGATEKKPASSLSETFPAKQCSSSFFRKCRVIMHGLLLMRTIGAYVDAHLCSILETFLMNLKKDAFGRHP